MLTCIALSKALPEQFRTKQNNSSKGNVGVLDDTTERTQAFKRGAPSMPRFRFSKGQKNGKVSSKKTGLSTNLAIFLSGENEDR